ELAISRSAIFQAAAHFGHSLEVLAKLPDDRQRQQTELKLRLASLFAMQHGGHGNNFASLLSVPGLDVDVKRSVWLAAEMSVLSSSLSTSSARPLLYRWFLSFDLLRLGVGPIRR